MISNLKFWLTWGKPPKWLKWLSRPVNWLDRRLWKFRHRYVKAHRYNVIYTDLPPGYYDVDTLMEAAMIKLLRRYVEDECGGREDLMGRINALRAELPTEENPIDTSTPEGDVKAFEAPMLERHASREEEVLAIYDWFVTEEPAIEAEIIELWEAWRENGGGIKWEKRTNNLFQAMMPPDEPGYMAKRRKLEVDRDKKTDEMLVRLVNIRKSLWT